MGSVSATLLFSAFIARPGKRLKQVVVLEPAAFQLQKFSLWVSVFSVTRYADAAVGCWKIMSNWEESDSQLLVQSRWKQVWKEMTCRFTLSYQHNSARWLWLLSHPSQVLLNYMDQMEESGFNIYEVWYYSVLPRAFKMAPGRWYITAFPDSASQPLTQEKKNCRRLQKAPHVRYLSRRAVKDCG